MHTKILLYNAKNWASLFLPIVLLIQCPFLLRAQFYNSGGTNIVSNGGVNIVLNNIGFNNKGVFTPSTGTVMFAGNVATANSFIQVDSGTAFNNLTINKSSNDVLLNTNIAVNGNLAFQSGNLQLNNFNVDLGSGAGAIVGENNNARIIGTSGGMVLKTATLDGPSAVNPGNIGIAITSAANLGLTQIKRGHVAPLLTGSNFGINRYFDIAPTNNASLNASITFNYLDAELNGQNDSTLVFWQSTDGGSTWSAIGEDGRNTVNNTVLKNDLSSLYRYTLSSALPTGTLPVKSIAPDESSISITFNKVFPNPARNEVNIVFYSNVNKDGEITLYAQSGQVLEIKKVPVVKGINTLTWNISKYAAGIYYFSFNGIPYKAARVIKMD